MVEVICSYSRLVYTSNSIVSASIQILQISKKQRSHAKFSDVEVQAVGLVTIDSRWSKIKTLKGTYYDESNTLLAEESPGAYLKKNSNSSLFQAFIFATKVETVRYNDILEGNGLIIQFHLPHSVLSSYKGLSISVQYHVVVKLVQEDEVKHLAFPFQVMSYGTNTIPYKSRLSEIMTFPVHALTSQKNPHHPLHQPDISDYDYRFEDIFMYKSKPYYLSDKDKGHLCTAEISSLYMEDDMLVSFAGNVIHIRFDLSQTSHRCTSVKASLIQSETRNDGSKVQDIVVSTVSRCTIDALTLQAKLHIPDTVTCGCDAPTIQVSYTIQVEIVCDHSLLTLKGLQPLSLSSPRASFSNTPTASSTHTDSPSIITFPSTTENVVYLKRASQQDDSNATGISDDPFIFTLPVRMVIPPSYLNETCNMYEEALGCLEPALSLTQQVV